MSCRHRSPTGAAVAVLMLACCRGRGPEPVPGWTDPVTGMEMALIQAGTFRMGSPEDEVGHEPGEKLHEVRLSRPFYLGKHEVTQAQWRRVMGENPSHFQGCDDCPVEQVSWWQARAFVRRLSELSGERFRLPTEAEWEYACRAGSTTPFATGENLTTEQANYDGNYPYPVEEAEQGEPGVYRARTTPVGSFAPNAWGLYDLHGNVWEWLADRYCDYPQGPVIDPVGDCGSELRVIRGGSWYFNADSARCGVRYTHRPQDVGISLGLRVVREIPDDSSALPRISLSTTTPEADPSP